MQELNDEFGEDGLVILAISDEEPGKVEEYLDANGITVRTAAGSRSKGDYGVSGIPASFLIDAEGNIVWSGHPLSLSKGTVKDALKGARKMSKAGFMAVRPSAELELTDALSKAAYAAADGKLAKALAAAGEVAADESATEADRKAGAAFVAELEAHATLLSKQAADYLKRRDVLTAILVYEALAKELKDSEHGQAASKELDRIDDDDELQEELSAAQAFEKARSAAAKLSSSKARKKYGQVADKYPGTRAGERAAAMVRSL